MWASPSRIRRTDKKSSLVLTVGFFHILARGFSRRTAGIAGNDGLVFLQGKVALLEQVIHFSSAQVRLLQDFGIGSADLAHLFISRRRASVVFLAAQQLAQVERGGLIMRGSVTPLFA